MISKTASFNIKGLACLGIAWHHYIFQSGIPTHFLFWFFSLWGMFFVGLFFFLSGYGLTQALGNKRPSFALFFKRVVRVLIPLIAIHLILYFPLLKLTLIEPCNTVKAVFGYLIKGSENPYLWFIQAILVMYLCFYISSIPKSKNVRIIVCFLLIVTYDVYVKWILKYSNNIYANNFPFLVGYIVALYEPQVKKLISNIKLPRLTVTMVTTSAVLFLLFQMLRDSILDDISCMCLGMSSIPIILLLNHLKCFEYRFCSFIGTCSFELYIIHWWIICYMKNEGYMIFSLFPILLYAGSCLLLAYIFSIIDRYLIAKYDALTSKRKIKI